MIYIKLIILFITLAYARVQLRIAIREERKAKLILNQTINEYNKRVVN
jgi:hypothetical protein